MEEKETMIRIQQIVDELTQVCYGKNTKDVLIALAVTTAAVIRTACGDKEKAILYITSIVKDCVLDDDHIEVIKCI